MQSRFTEAQIIGISKEQEGGTPVATVCANAPSFPPDHAGLFETTLLDGLTDGLIDLPSLGTGADQGDRFVPASPIWGIVGADPREIQSVERAALVSHVGEAIVSLDLPK